MGALADRRGRRTRRAVYGGPRRDELRSGLLAVETSFHFLGLDGYNASTMTITTLLRAATLSLLLALASGCSDDAGPPAGDIGPDVATTAYCAELDKKCRAGDAKACAEAKASCPFTSQYDSGTPG